MAAKVSTYLSTQQSSADEETAAFFSKLEELYNKKWVDLRVITQGSLLVDDHRTQVVGSYECLSAHSLCIILFIWRTRIANYKWIPDLSPQYQQNIYIYTLQ